MEDILKLSVGIIIALLIGAACRYFNLPVPAPPTIYGVLLIMAITVGYIITDNIMPKATKNNSQQTEQTK